MREGVNALRMYEIIHIMYEQRYSYSKPKNYFINYNFMPSKQY